MGDCKAQSRTFKDLQDEVDKFVQNTRCAWSFLCKEGTHECFTVFKQRREDAVTVEVSPPTSNAMTLEPAMPGSSFLANSVIFSECPCLASYVQNDVICIEKTKPPAIKCFLLALTLRWFVRLHVAMISLDFLRCSLKQYLFCLLNIVVSTKEETHLWVLLEDFIDTLRRRIGSSWASFVEFVSSFDNKADATNVAFSAFEGRQAVVSNAFMWQIANDIVVAYVAQQPLGGVAFEEFEALFAQFAAPPPALSPKFDALAKWTGPHLIKVKVSGAVFREAHHWVVSVELGHVQCSKSVVCTMCSILEHHTFPVGLRRRVVDVVKKLEWDPCTVTKLEAAAVSDHDVAALRPARLDDLAGGQDAVVYDAARFSHDKICTTYMRPMGMRVESPQTRSRFLNSTIK